MGRPLLQVKFRLGILALVTLVGVACAVDEVRACSVCFGDPASPMVQGALAGVWVLVGVVGMVLTGIAGTGWYWVHRGRRLARRTHSASDGMDGQERRGS